MTRFQWILLILALVTWIPSYIWFFHHDARWWWRGRRERREQEKRAHEEFLAEQQRLRDELAAKYYPGSSAPNGPGT